MSHTDLSYSRNSSRVMVLVRLDGFGRLKLCLLNTRMYSCTSRRIGLLADFHEPHAVEAEALAALFQMISPRIRKPSSIACSAMKACSGIYGLRPRLATLMHIRPPGTSTRQVSFHTRPRKAR